MKDTGAGDDEHELGNQTGECSRRMSIPVILPPCATRGGARPVHDRGEKKERSLNVRSTGFSPFASKPGPESSDRAMIQTND